MVPEERLRCGGVTTLDDKLEAAAVPTALLGPGEAVAVALVLGTAIPAVLFGAGEGAALEAAVPAALFGPADEVPPAAAAGGATWACGAACDRPEAK